MNGNFLSKFTNEAVVPGLRSASWIVIIMMVNYTHQADANLYNTGNGRYLMRASALRRKKNCIIIVWLAGILITLFLLFLLEKNICTKNGREELLEQADIVSEQIPAIIENDFYSQAAI